VVELEHKQLVMIRIYTCKVKDKAVSHNSTLTVVIYGFFVSSCLCSIYGEVLVTFRENFQV
jgi:hypothetical protein